VERNAAESQTETHAECQFPCHRPGRAGAEWSASARAGRGVGLAGERQAERSGRWFRRGVFGWDVIVMPMKFPNFRDEFGACPLAAISARVAGLQLPNHSPDAVSLSAFDDLQGS
jgi:hypothetical protein